MELTQEQKLYAEIVQKAWEDLNFKEELISNPIDAIEKMTGQKLNLPKGMSLKVCDQADENVIYINIPAIPKYVLDYELSENQLEEIAGGDGGFIQSITEYLFGRS